MEMRQTQLQSALDHARQEMFDFKTKQDDVTSARSSEVDILNQDLERANEVIFLLPVFSISLLFLQRASNAERLVDKLREQLEQLQSSVPSASAMHHSDDLINQEESERKFREKLELELAAKEREIGALVVDTQKLQSTLIKVKETSVAQVRPNE